MSVKEVIRAWKDPEFRLDRAARAGGPLLAHPAGAIELSMTELDAAAGGQPTYTMTVTGQGCSQTPCSDNIGPCRTFRCTHGCIVWG